jgi:hypothetical protein
MEVASRQWINELRLIINDANFTPINQSISHFLTFDTQINLNDFNFRQIMKSQTKFIFICSQEGNWRMRWAKLQSL